MTYRFSLLPFYSLCFIMAVGSAGCSSTANATKAATQPAVAKASLPVVATQPVQRPLDELLLFYPRKYPEGNWFPSGLIWDDAWFTADDGTKLHGWYCPSPDSRAVILFAHGNAGNLSFRTELMKYLQRDLKVTAMIFDYRGFGRSQGTPTVSGILQDARAARRRLAELARIKESQIVLCGESLGGAVAVDLAGDGARALILGNTFASLKDAAKHLYPKLAWMVPSTKLDSITRIAQFQGPLLQCHGDADQLIPFEQGLRLFEAAKGPKKFIRMPGIDHHQGLTGEFLQELRQFIDTLPQ